ncbi:Glycosyl transferase family 2 [Nostocoides japonicum T1-X7]|uniref:Glycosyl transferase family 2 n=1 Tax=Nostocoides japonicum T1-X7 TaxID=1194083 RepID=A0A077LUY3_9MICO|nr:glycosyltransferase [Tetrasphaera japonica]CCH77456.1 Glycosyl transferase family 2 [Tetrasphaera japonica T1-X7]
MRPAISYVMPVLNEATRLETAVRAVLDQEYDGAQEVVIALAPSSDGTDAVAARLAADDARVTVVANPAVHIPAGLNAAIAASHGEIVVRVDSHTELPAGYTERMVSSLERTGAANVGGIMRARGDGPVQRSVARAYNSPLGLGGGVYHGGRSEGPADSVYLGTFRREVLDEVGGYDESLWRGEDYDLNARIRAAGHAVIHIPDVEVAYHPRSSWGALARQMYATGSWRGVLVRRHGRTKPRYLAAPLLVIGLGASVVVGVASTVTRVPRVMTAVYAAPAGYLAVLGYALAGGLGARSARDRVLDVGTLATMHLSWGAGFLVGCARGVEGVLDTSRVREPTVPAADA